MRVTIDLNEETFAAKDGNDIIIFQDKGERVTSVRLSTADLTKIMEHNPIGAGRKTGMVRLTKRNYLNKNKEVTAGYEIDGSFYAPQNDVFKFDEHEATN